MKEYLGDGVYATFDGYMLTLTTENGLDTLNTIYIEPAVWRSLLEFKERSRARELERER